ncbi:hypothetical protein ACTD5D_20020 [Nocardia takedensis]|uniref:hypothetical protein n=1 Tax=Nocardia takedensis TaxID=259390 RepID=UPI0002D415AB|nr:hypothetical protein [Nocardia takedensis]
MMRELDDRGLRGHVHVGIDDNLSGRWIKQLLTSEDIAYMAAYPNHSRGGCFKGFDEHSFTDNTGAPAPGFARQFEVMADLIEMGFDTYAYATFTGRSRPDRDTASAVSQFVDRLQRVHPLLPLRTIPLEVRPYSAVGQRLPESESTLFYDLQYKAIVAWEHELASRFGDQQQVPYEDIALH